MPELIVPRLGVSVTEITLVEWLIADGQAVSEGDAVVNVATDKTEVEIEATANGVLRHRGEVDQTYAVGHVIGFIE